MTDDLDGVGAVPRRAAEAAAALEALKVPAEEAAASIEAAFDRAGSGLARSLARAAAAAPACPQRSRRRSARSFPAPGRTAVR